MGRPFKTYYEYFPFDVMFFHKTSVLELQRETGNDGVVAFLHLCCMAYEEGRYYVPNNKTTLDIIKRDVNISKKKAINIYNKFIEFGFINELFLSRYGVFTSLQLVNCLEKMSEKRENKFIFSEIFSIFEEFENDANIVKQETLSNSNTELFPKKPPFNSTLMPGYRSGYGRVSGQESKSKSKSKSININYLSSDEDKSASPCQETHAGQLAHEELKDNVSGGELSEETDPEEQVQTIPIEQIDYKAIMEDYNRICGEKFPQVKMVSDVRRKNIKARSKELKEHGMTWEEFFQKVAASDFLAGNNNRGFVASFDWIVLPTNMAKIVNGNYDNRIIPEKANERKYNNGYYGKHDPKYNPREPGRPEDYNDVWAGYPR